jgi:hypothetical protein
VLAVDYVLAGLVKEQMDAEVGEAIHNIHSSGLGGLKALGYQWRDKEGVGWAFGQVRSILAVLFTADEKAQMDFGLILVEHMLCKLTQLSNKNQFQ